MTTETNRHNEQVANIFNKFFRTWNSNDVPTVTTEIEISLYTFANELTKLYIKEE